MFNHMASKAFQVERLSEFDNHKVVSFIHDSKSGLKGFIAIHSVNSNYPSFGATRFWHYDADVEALSDALRLSRMMSYKSALADLPYGGAKGVIMHPYSRVKDRKQLLQAYAQRVNYLGGRFVTGTDVGLNGKDIQVMRQESSYIVGTKVNPEQFTGLGIFYSIQECLGEIFGTDKISGRSFAIQGLGKVGSELLRLLYQRGGKVFAADISRKKIEQVRKSFPKIEIVKPADIHKLEVDVYSPCALSNALNILRAKQLRCKIVAGGANNQLANERVGEVLYERGILYAPDYVINAGGLISVVDEYENKSSNTKRLSERVSAIKSRVRKILNESKKQNLPPNVIADEMGRNIISKYQ